MPALKLPSSRVVPIIIGTWLIRPLWKASISLRGMMVPSSIGPPTSGLVALAGTASATSPLVGGPMLDGTIIPRQLIDAFQSGRINQVPMMMGTTRDEGNFNAGITQYFKPGRAALDESDYKGYLQRTYGGN